MEIIGQEQNKSLRIFSLLYKLMKRREALTERLAYYIEPREIKDEEDKEWAEHDKAFAEYHLNVLDQMIELVNDDTLPLHIKEFLVHEDYRHLECLECEKQFTAVGAYFALASKSIEYVARFNGDSVYGYEFACCIK